MEKAIFAIRKWLGIVDYDPTPLEERIETLESELMAFRQALKAKAAKAETPFEPIPRAGYITPKRYIPLATRRRQAEIASMGPQTHTEQVRENNIKAFESA